MLYVYIASDCRICAISQRLINQLRALRPGVRMTVVDTDSPESAVPAHVIGTPMYLWNDTVLFMGNPDMSELLERVDTYSQATAHAQQVFE